MDPFIARQIITDKLQHTVGCEIILANPKAAAGKDELYESAAADNISRLDLDKFTDGRTAYITFTRSMLTANIPARFGKDKLMIQIDGSLINDRSAHNLIRKYRQAGYKIAVIGFKFDSGYFGIMDSFDYIKVDFRDFTSPELENILRMARTFNKKIIAYNIECAEAYAKAKLCGCTYYQGMYIYGKIPTAVRRKGIMREGFNELFNELYSGRSDIVSITNIIGRYPEISEAVQALANSLYFASDVRTVGTDKAAAKLGEENLRKYVYIIGFKAEDGSMPGELIKFALLRGMLCSELAGFADSMPITSSEAFSMGTVSMLGRLLHKPLAEVMPDTVCASLISGQGRAGMLYKMICAYEKADMKLAAEFAAALGIPPSILPQKYRECVSAADEMWHKLITPAEFRE